MHPGGERAVNDRAQLARRISPVCVIGVYLRMPEMAGGAAFDRSCVMREPLRKCPAHPPLAQSRGEVVKVTALIVLSPT